MEHNGSMTEDGILFPTPGEEIERLRRPNAFGEWVRTCAWKGERFYIAYMASEVFDADPNQRLAEMRDALVYALRGNFAIYSTHGVIP